MRPERGHARGDLVVGIAAVVVGVGMAAFPVVLILRALGVLQR